MTLWVCRAGRHGEHENYFIEKGVIAITWSDLEIDISGYKTKETLKPVLAEVYSNENKYVIANYTGQLLPFVNSMRVGEKVLLPSKIKPGMIYVGTIDGDCIYTPDTPPYRHIRKVIWEEKLLRRSDLDADILNSLGASITIFQLADSQAERIFKTKKTAPSNTDVIENSSIANLEDDALEQISEKIIQKFKGYDMQRVIASIFKAKGYETFVSKGADKGIDVLASDGPLGFGGTKICIQVKSEENPIDRAVFIELIGTMKRIDANYGLLVSWGGFKSSLDSEKRDNFFAVKFWDHNDIVREFLDNYDKLDDWIKTKVPLKKIWVIDDQSEPE